MFVRNMDPSCGPASASMPQMLELRSNHGLRYNDDDRLTPIQLDRQGMTLNSLGSNDSLLCA